MKNTELIKTLVFRPGEEPVFEMIPATQEAFEQLLDNGWVQHTQLGTRYCATSMPKRMDCRTIVHT